MQFPGLPRRLAATAGTGQRWRQDPPRWFCSLRQSRPLEMFAPHLDAQPTTEKSKQEHHDGPSGDQTGSKQCSHLVGIIGTHLPGDHGVVLVGVHDHRYQWHDHPEGEYRVSERRPARVQADIAPGVGGDQIGDEAEHEPGGVIQIVCPGVIPSPTSSPVIVKAPIFGTRAIDSITMIPPSRIPRIQPTNINAGPAKPIIPQA